MSKSAPRDLLMRIAHSARSITPTKTWRVIGIAWMYIVVCTDKEQERACVKTICVGATSSHKCKCNMASWLGDE